MNNDESPERDYEIPFVLHEMTELDCSVSTMAQKTSQNEQKNADPPRTDASSAEKTEKDAGSEK